MSVEDLANISGIGEKKAQNIKKEKLKLKDAMQKQIYAFKKKAD